MSIQVEYEKIKALFVDADEKKVQLLDGAMLECARIKVELDELHRIVNETGLLKVHETNLALQKELPISKIIVKLRANYLNYLTKLAQELGTNLDEDDYDLEDFE